MSGGRPASSGGLVRAACGTGRLSGLRWCVRGAQEPLPLLLLLLMLMMLLLSARARGSTECGGGEKRKEGW